MLKWLLEKIIGWPWCWHRWKIIRKLDIVNNSGEYVVAVNYHLQCERCGDVKKRYLGNSHD